MRGPGLLMCWYRHARPSCFVNLVWVCGKREPVGNCVCRAQLDYCPTDGAVAVPCAAVP